MEVKIELTVEQIEFLRRLIENPPPPNEKLKDLYRRGNFWNSAPQGQCLCPPGTACGNVACPHLPKVTC